LRLILNGWFLGEETTGSGQYLQGLLRYLFALAPEHDYVLVVWQPWLRGSLPQMPTGWALYPIHTPFDGVSADLAKVWFEQVGFPHACRRLQADVAHVPYWGSPWWTPCPTLVTVHDLIPLVLPAYRGGWRQRLYSWLVRRSARRAHTVITDSHASRRDIVRYLGIPDKRVHVIHLAADKRYRPVTNPEALSRVRTRYGLPDRFLLYLGGFDVRKNVGLLLQAVAQVVRSGDFANWKLVVAGRLPSAGTSFSPDPRQTTRELSIKSHVRFIGWVDEADKPALYTQAWTFCFPSAYEGFGLPVLEAMACGCPPIVSDVASLPEVVGEAGWIVPVGDVKALAAAIRETLHLTPEVHERARREARQRAAQFDARRSVQALLNLIESANQ